MKVYYKMKVEMKSRINEVTGNPKNFSSRVNLLIAARSLVLAIMLGIFGNVQATSYYSKSGATDPTALASWVINADGSASANPANFTTSGDVFNVRAGQTMSASSATWTVTGAILINGTLTFTANSNKKLTAGSLTVASGGSFTMNNKSTLVIKGTLTVTGTISFANTLSNTLTGDITLNSGASWAETGNGTFSLGGNFTNNATTFAGGTGVHTFTGSGKVFSGSTTTSIPSATINGTYTNNGTLTVNTALSGTGSLTQGSSGILTIGGTSAITTLVASATGNTVNYSGTAQILKAITYHNLTLSGSGGKTFPTGTKTVNGTLSIENGTNANTLTDTLGYGPAAALQYNAGASARTVSSEWPATFSGSGGVTVKGTGAITLNGAKVLSPGIPLTITSGATLTPGANLLTLGGNFTKNGTLTSGSGGISINGSTTQAIDAFTTTGPVTISGSAKQTIAGFSAGAVSMTKSGGIATMTGNINASSFTINGGGTLNLGNSLTHTFSGDVTLTSGTLDGGFLNTVNANSTSVTAWNGSGTVFTPGTSTVVFGGGAQTLSASSPTFYNVTFSGTTVTKTITNLLTVNNDLNIVSSAKVLLPTGTTSNTTVLKYGGVAQNGGTYGSSSSIAVNKDDTYFAASTGIISASTNPRFVITGSATQTAGTTQNLTITVVNPNRTPLIGYTGSKVLIFSGANSSGNPVTAPSVTDASGTAQNLGSSTILNFTDGVADVTGGSKGVLALYKAENAIISITDGTYSSLGSDRLFVSVSANSANKVAFTTDPGGSTIGTVWPTQPVVTLQDAYGNTITGTAKNVTAAIGNDAGGGSTLGGTTTVLVNTNTGKATFTDLAIDKLGSGYTLTASAPSLSSATSGTFTITNTIPTLSSITPTTTCKGNGFTLTVYGSNFNYTSVVQLDGVSKATTFVNSGQLTASISSSDIAIAGTVLVTVSNSGTGGGISAVSTLTVDGVTVIPTITQPTCASFGSISLSVSGGMAPYTYSWTSTNGVIATIKDIVGLQAGTYTVTVTDALGCSTTVGSLVLNAPTGCTGVTVCQSNTSAILSIDPNPANTSYTWTVPAGAVINSGQGTTSISINWTGVSVGEYQVCVVGNNSCGASTQSCIPVYVRKPSAIAYADASCSGGTLNLHAIGGLSYAWSGPSSFTSLTDDLVIYNSSASNNGTYTVTVTDGSSCSATATVDVTVATTPAISLNTSTNATCGTSNGALDINVTGGTVYTYNWDDPASSTTQDISGLSSDFYTVTVSSNGCSASKIFTVNDATGISTTLASKVDVSCYGGNTGSITINNPSGGTSPYTYLWSNGSSTQNISSLAAGTYTVVISDNNGCQGSFSQTIAGPGAPLQASVSQSNVTCNGGGNGTITISGSTGGGSGTYEYSINGGSAWQTSGNYASLTPSTYDVRIRDKVNTSCTAILNGTVSLTQPTVLSATVSLTNVSCNGANDGRITISAPAGGSGSYEYSINGGISWQASGVFISLSNATYDVRIRDKVNTSCSVVLNAALVITQPTTISLSKTTTDVTCNGEANGAVDLTVSNGTPFYTYVWNTGATTQDISGLPAGTYEVTVTDAHGCKANISSTINQPVVLSGSVAATAATCNGGSTGSADLTVSGGTPGFTFLWSNTATTQDVTNIPAGLYSVTITDSKGCTANASMTVTESAAISVNGAVTNVKCFNGSTGAIDISVIGGTGSYTYSWTASNGGVVSAGHNTDQDLTGLTAGTYQVLVTDASLCNKTVSFTITQPAAALSISSSKTDLTCNGYNDGSIDLSVSGGTFPFNYAWTGPGVYTATSEDISGLTNGSYSVTITDANLCITNTSVNIIQPNVLSASATPSNVLCKNESSGSILLTVNDGNGGNSFLWSNGSTDQNPNGLNAGNYTVTITDSKGCTTTASATVGEPMFLSISSTVTGVKCFGGSTGIITISPSGGIPGYTYSWNDGLTSQNRNNIAAGNYSVTVTDANSCKQSSTLTIDEPSAISVSVNTADRVCLTANGSAFAEVSGGTSPYTYSWTKSPSATVIGTTDNIPGLDVGTYTVTVIDANLCTATGNGTVNSLSCLAPVAGDDNFTTGYNTEIVNGSVATNDSDPEGALLSFAPLTNPTAAQGTIIWDESKNGTFTYTPTPGYVGTFQVTYRVTDPTGMYSDATMTITVVALPTAAVNSSEQSICASGGVATLAGSSPTIGTGAWSVISGPSTSLAQFSSISNPIGTFTPAGGAGNYLLCWTISNAPNTPSTAYAVITVNPVSVGGMAAATATTLCSGGSTSITLSGYTGTIQWQQSADGTSGWTDVTGGIGATTATYTTPALISTTYYRAEVTNGACMGDNSNPATVNVNSATPPPTGSATQLFCSASNPKISDLIITGSGIKWYDTSSGGSVIATNTSLVDGTTYYASQTISGCESASRLGVLAVVNGCNPSVTLSVDNATIPEAGGIATFTATLSYASQLPVTVNLGYTGTATGGGTDYTASTSSIVIAAGNTSGTATVTAVDDNIYETVANETVIVDITSVINGTESGTQQQTTGIVDNDSQPSITIDDVSAAEGSNLTFTVILSNPSVQIVSVNYATSDGTATVSDNDYSAISTTALTFASGETSKNVVVSTVADTKTESDETLNVNLSGASNSSIGDNTGVGTINNDDVDPTVTLSITDASISEAAGTATVMATLNHTSYLPVTVNLAYSGTASGAGTDYSIPGSSITIPAGNLTGTLTITAVDDYLAESSETVIVDISSVTNGSESGTQQVTTSITDNDVAGITVSPISGHTSETGGTATFTIVLNTQPTADVTIGLFSNDLTEGTVSPASVIFTSANWNIPQTITVTGVDDNLIDGDVSYTVVTAGATSVDGNYNGMNPSDVTVVNDDNDVAGFILSKLSGVTSESGTTDNFTVVLDAQPASDVVISVTSGDLTEGTVSPATLTFTPANWDTPQSVTITGVDDAISDGAINYNITLSVVDASSDDHFDALSDQMVTVTNADNDSPGITVSAVSGHTTEAGGTATFTVVLNTQPTADVTIGLSSSDLTEGIVSAASVTFTSANWNTPQTVTVTGISDAVTDGNITYVIITAPAISSDTNYGGLNASDVTVINDDLPVNNAPIVHVPVLTQTMSEGGQSSLIDIPANITDVEGDALTISVLTNPKHGTAIIDGTGKLVYTPNANFSGNDTITYQVCDNGTPSLCAIGTVIITVTPAANANHVPVISDLSVTTAQDQAISFDRTDFISKFTDSDNDTLVKIQIVSLPSHGTLRILGTDVIAGQEILVTDLNKLEFVPEKDFNGEISFEWGASDGKDYSASSASVRITVSASDKFIPEGFSPNGDGINDNFYIKGADKYIVTLRIYNRWGNLVYESKHYLNDWSGDSNAGMLIGKKLPDGTYFYTVNFNNGEKEKVGYITINR